MKTLFFEGAGWAEADTSKATDLQNCRIRTAFSVGGKVYYLECMVCTDRKKAGQYQLLIDAFEDITVARSLFCDYVRLPEERNTQLEACKAALLDFINTTTGADFADIETVNDGSYRVFPEAPEGVDHRRVFRLGNTGEVYVAPQVLTAYEQFKVNARNSEGCVLQEWGFTQQVDMSIDFCRKILARRGYKFTGTSQGKAIFNNSYIWAGAIQEGNRIAIRLDKYSTVNG
jgi:hypothetical protein